MALLTKRPFCTSQSTQPFRIEISSEHSSSGDKLLTNAQTDDPDMCLLITENGGSNQNLETQWKLTQEETDDNPQKEPLQAGPAIDGAYSIVKSTMPLSSL